MREKAIVVKNNKNQAQVEIKGLQLAMAAKDAQWVEKASLRVGPEPNRRQEWDKLLK